MAMALRHMGEFLSRKGVVWRVEILQDNYSGNVGQLTFEADEALVINWKHTDKEEVICGSEATLKIESPGDRTYEDLYTIEVGKIRMDVYRENSLYWSGTLDPEFYEEPYEKARYYVVTLTFSDFGILDRLKYNLSGMQTLEAILLDAIDRSKVCASLLANSYCTTYFAGTNTKATLSALSMRSENFYDEDAEPSTLKEVVTGILQPLAMKMIQRNGHIYIFDLNGLYTLAQSRAITWDGDSQTMGVDKVANNVKVNFSPYSSAELINGELEYGGEYSADDTPQWLAEPGHHYYTYRPDYNPTWNADSQTVNDSANFSIYISTEGKGLHYLNPMARYCHILPLVGGPSETTAIAWAFHSGGHGGLDTGWPKRILNDVRMEHARQIMQTHRVFLPKFTTEDAKSYYVRLSLEMLLDARYNPFTEGNEYNEEGNYERMKTRTGYAFVPIAVNIYDSAGNAVCHYDNSSIAKGGTKGHLAYCKGSWVSGEGGFGSAYLEYYDPNDLWESAGICGWKKNRQCIGRPGKGNVDVVLYDSFKQMADGQYMPYPPEGGYIEVTVYEGVQCFDMDETVSPLIPIQTPWESPRYWVNDNRYNQCRWLLYKAPKIELVKNNLIFDAAELDDVEYSGYINKHAKEEISIDTVCGTANTTCPTAKGIYCRASDSLQIQQLKRAGVTDHPEKLLIGTLYSQYATRHTTLEGEAVIDPGGLCKYTEQNQPGKVFMMSEEQQDVITDTTQAVYTELSPDEYDAIEEVNN